MTNDDTNAKVFLLIFRFNMSDFLVRFTQIKAWFQLQMAASYAAMFSCGHAADSINFLGVINWVESMPVDYSNDWLKADVLKYATSSN